MIKMQRERTNIITETKLEEIVVLRTSFEKANEQKIGMLAEIAVINARRIQLEQELEEKSAIMNQLAMKWKTAKDSVSTFLPDPRGAGHA